MQTWPSSTDSNWSGGNTYTITTTWDNSSAAPRPIVWNGGYVTYGPPASPALDEPEGPIEWLRRRVDEVRVDLAEAA